MQGSIGELPLAVVRAVVFEACVLLIGARCVVYAHRPQGATPRKLCRTCRKFSPSLMF